MKVPIDDPIVNCKPKPTFESNKSKNTFFVLLLTIYNFLMTIPRHLLIAPTFSKNPVNTESYLKCYLYLDIFNENNVLSDVHNFLVSTLYLTIYCVIFIFHIISVCCWEMSYF